MGPLTPAVAILANLAILALPGSASAGPSMFLAAPCRPAWGWVGAWAVVSRSKALACPLRFLLSPPKKRTVKNSKKKDQILGEISKSPEISEGLLCMKGCTSGHRTILVASWSALALVCGDLPEAIPEARWFWKKGKEESGEGQGGDYE